jgi:RNA polymerase sigma-70 factor (ECF subfamily)
MIGPSEAIRAAGSNRARQNRRRRGPLLHGPATHDGGGSPLQSTLADSLAAGDPAAFAALYDRLATRLFNTARTLASSAADAEDVVQDVFVELARSRERLAGVVDLEAYVFTMLRHAVSRRRRRFAIDRKAVGRIAEERLRVGDSRDPAAFPDDELAAAVAALPVEQREVIALKIDGGLTFAEIAAVMQTSLNTAASRYRYALEKLRAALAPKEVRR